MTRDAGRVEYTVAADGDFSKIEFRGRRHGIDDMSLIDRLGKELDVAQDGILPVVLGAGSGAVLDALAECFFGSVAVVDAEPEIQKLFPEGRRDRPGLDVSWICGEDADQAWGELEDLRQRAGACSFLPLASSTWLRVRPRLYAAVLRRIKGRQKADRLDLGRSSKIFASTCILFLRFGYFLEQEIMNGFRKLDVDVHEFFPEKEGCADARSYAGALLERVRRIRPNFVLSVNSLGGDFEGGLTDLLHRMGVRFVSWFVDSPELFLHGQKKSAAADPIFFCCDPDYEKKLRPFGFTNLHSLPLAADASRFNLNEPVRDVPARIDVSFIGTTWVDKLAAVHCNFYFPAYVLRTFKQAAREFIRAKDRTMAGFLLRAYPEMWKRCLDEMDVEKRRGVLHLLCWEANRVYRSECIERIAGFSSLIAGDRHWERAKGITGAGAIVHPPIGYYTPDLLEFYRLARVNFNCSGMQMPRAVNQRIFDVPAAGGFLLTDHRDQLVECFDPTKEVACWASVSEIQDTIRRWVSDEKGRAGIVDAARKRIAGQHTYRHRLEVMLRILGRY